ncbi:hypothetical protein [Kribbella catacumbae]|uniref:hypothetical protein n=1 Tax=Kribbella catacumbae TaxID=460086 RepID=UPI000372CACC|nr:hypothetical protein [Kribbella catacumbae]
MTTLRIENTVTDYDDWKAAFDSYAAVRKRMGVRFYRITRNTADDHQVFVELDFPDREKAEIFLTFLTDKVWRTPRSRALLTEHHQPRFLELVDAAAIVAEAS